MKTIYQLKKYDNLIIEGNKYYVQGVIELRQGAFLWKEFKLMSISDRQVEYWLSVEKTAEDAILYTKTAPFLISETIEHAGETFSLLESGKGIVMVVNDIDNVTKGDSITFNEYQSEDKQRLLSCEKWTDGDYYYQGQRYPLSAIGVSEMNKSQDIALAASKEHNLKYWQSLKLGQQLKIEKQVYYVAGIVKYKQGLFKWMEYKLAGGNRELWLSVEDVGNEQVELSLFHNIPFHKVASVSGEQIKYRNEIYDCIEKGKGYVSDASGDVDFDYHESFSFREYQFKDKYISYEKWSDEEEYSYGEPIQIYEITILEGERKEVKNKYTNKAALRWIQFIGFIVVGLIIVMPFIKDYFKYPILEELIANRYFIYETSVTSNEDKEKKSSVYRTHYSPDEACQILMKVDPEHVEQIISSKDATDGERLIQTNKETVMIYPGEDNVTYVQASARMDTTSNYNSYRSNNPHRVRRFYYHSSRWNRGERNMQEHVDPHRYIQSLMNARQASIRARNAQGGGTGFGK